MRRLFMLVSLATLPFLAACSTEDRPKLIVGAASSLLPLLTELESVFEKDALIDLTITYNATGAIARQIEQGAPIDVFLSADQALVLQMVEEGFLRQDSICALGQGLLVVIRPQGGEISTFLDARRIAIANPETAPYGAAAKQLLEMNALWEQVKSRVVYAESALQAVQFVRSAEADIGLVPLALVAQNRQGVEHISERTHGVFGTESVTQIGAIATTSVQIDAATRFLNFLLSKAAQNIFRRHGYAPMHIEATR